MSRCSPSTPVSCQCCTNRPHPHPLELGYSTQLYLNACCRPPSCLSPEKIATSMPFCLPPATLSEATQQFFQTMLDLSREPLEVLSRVPEGQGLAVTAHGPNGERAHRLTVSPRTLSQYWSSVMDFATSVLQCCENFISAAPPSVPCLICHPFVREPTPPPSPTHTHTIVTPSGTQSKGNKHHSSSLNPPADQDDMDVHQAGSPVPPITDNVSMSAETALPSLSVPHLLSPTAHAYSPSHAPSATLSNTTPSISFRGSSPSLPLPQPAALHQPNTHQFMWLIANKSLLGLNMPGQQQPMATGGFPANPRLQWPPSAQVSFALPSTTANLQLSQRMSSVLLRSSAGLAQLPFNTLPTLPVSQSTPQPLSPLSAVQGERNNTTPFSSEQSPSAVGQQTQLSTSDNTAATDNHTNEQNMRDNVRELSGKGRAARSQELPGKRTTRSQAKRQLPIASPPPTSSHSSSSASTVQDETSNANVLISMTAPPTDTLDVGLSLPSSAPPQEWTCAQVSEFIECITDQRCSKVFLEQVRGACEGCGRWGTCRG